MKRIPSLLMAWALVAAPRAQAFEPKGEGVSIPIQYTGEVLGNFSGGHKRGAICEGLLIIGLDLDFEKLAGLPGLTFHVAGSDLRGPSVTERCVHDLGAISNIDARNGTRLHEAWAQQELFEGRLSLRMGQMLADEEFFATEGSGLFINGAFGALPLVGHNIPTAPFYPLSAPGVRVAYKYNEKLAFQVGVYEGDMGEADVNRHNTRYRWGGREGTLALAEWSYAPWEGASYKIGAFYRQADRSVSTTDAWHTSTGGAYFLVDQPICKGLDAFLRIGGAPEDRSVVPFYFDAGLTYKGLVVGREEDRLGLGFSHTRLSHRVRLPGDAAHESILELTYKAKVNAWCELQPDLQYVLRPGASRENQNAWVAGLRCVLSF